MDESQDRVFLDRAYELALRAVENTSPNPPVGAVVVRDGTIVGEGYHHRPGAPHAEIEALQEAGDAARGATLYISLEPCNHQGRTPPCVPQLIRSKIARAVIGTRDPNPLTDGAGLQQLRKAGVAVDVCDDPQAAAIIEPFARAIRSLRPYVSLKIAMSLDGFIASRPNAQEWLTGEKAHDFVRELRISHDAVGVGAGTIRVDNPQLTVRPAHHRAREYVRVVFCESDPIDPSSAVLKHVEGYARTIVLAPRARKAQFAALEQAADLLYAGAEDDAQLDLEAALRALRERGISSLLCEGGPTVARRLLEHTLVDRFYWLIAPKLLRGERAVPALPSELSGHMIFDRAELLEPDLMVSGLIESDV